MIRMPSLLDPQLEVALNKEIAHLKETEVPIISVSAAYKEDVKGMFGFPENETLNDVVFSRAHYSMALGVAVEAWGKKIDPKKAWLVDPTNYVSEKNWGSIELTEVIGKTLARRPFLKKLKDFVDKFGRSKLPILSSITPPLLHLVRGLDKPILSFHIASGNILAEHGKTVVQMITDPHVRDEYLNNAHRDNFYLLVFDDNTKTEVLEKAKLMDKKIDPKRVIVTGPPIDPRVLAAAKNKRPWRSGQLNLVITTGGLGTNKQEIKELLKKLLPELRKRPHEINLLVYAGTHADIAKMAIELAEEEHIAVGDFDNSREKFRVIHHPQIVDANELLIKYGFPWADGFITKPSGDMAYDAVASGSFILTMAEWGEWEHNIRVIFEQAGVGREAEIEDIVKQLEALKQSQGQAQSWVEQAMLQTKKLDKIFYHGAENILEAYHQVAKNK